MTATTSSLLHSVFDDLHVLYDNLHHSLSDNPASLYLAIPVLLFLLRVAYANATRSRSKRSRSMSYVVKWGRERLHFVLPPPETKLSVIRDELAAYTQLPPNSFKLVHAGAVMKDDNAPISTYGIKPHSTIALIGGDAVPPSAAHATPPSEQSTLAQIRTELDTLHALTPAVDAFLATLQPSPAYPPAQTREHTRLAELLLQGLLRLDAVAADAAWLDARAARKSAVREVQALLDRLDAGWRARPRA